MLSVTCYETAAWVAQDANDPDGALTFARRAQERLRESGVVRPDWDAVLLARIADAYYMRGNTVEAERYYADSLALPGADRPRREHRDLFDPQSLGRHRRRNRRHAARAA